MRGPGSIWYAPVKTGVQARIHEGGTNGVQIFIF